MAEQKTDLKSMTIPELEAYLAELGEAKFRAKQIFTWMHRGAAYRSDQCTWVTVLPMLRWKI